MEEFYKYPKIPTIYKRDTDGSKKLVEDDFIDNTIESLAELDWRITEKFDGMNVGVVWDGHKVRFQGRTEKTSFSADQFDFLKSRFGDNASEELFEQAFGEKTVVLYGELIGKNIQKVGRLYSSEYQFMLFDIYFPGTNLWAKDEVVQEISKTFHVMHAMPYYPMSLKEAVEVVKQCPISALGDARIEGLVCRPPVELFNQKGERVIVKIKVEDFLTRLEMKEKTGDKK